MIGSLMKTKQMIIEEWPAVMDLQINDHGVYNDFNMYELPNGFIIKLDHERDFIVYAEGWDYRWRRPLVEGRKRVTQFMKRVATTEELVIRCEAALAIEKALED